MIKYSFIITCYNEEKHIKKCLNSIKNQKPNNFEIIVINDGSTDNSLSLITETLSKFKKSTIVTQTNKGLSYSRNKGMELAKGEYLMFVDGDDYITQDYLIEIDKQITSDLDLLKFEFSNNKNLKNKIQRLNGASAIKSLIEKKQTFEPAVLYVYKTKYMKENNFKFENNRYHEDFGLIPKIIILTKKIKIIPNGLYVYEQTNDSITRTVDQKIKTKRFYDILHFYDQYIIFIDKTNLNENTKKMFKSYISNAVLYGTINVQPNVWIKEVSKREIYSNIMYNRVSGTLKKIKFKLKEKKWKKHLK